MGEWLVMSSGEMVSDLINQQWHYPNKVYGYIKASKSGDKIFWAY